MFGVRLRPYQVVVSILHFAITCLVFVCVGFLPSYWQWISAFSLPYIVWSTINLFRFFHMHNQGVPVFHSLRHLVFITQLQENERRDVIIWYWKKGMIQGIELQLLGGNKALSLSLQPFYQQHVVSHDVIASIHHHVEYFLRDHPRYQIRIVTNKELPTKST